MSLLALMFISVFIYFYIKDALKSEVLSHLESVASIQSHRLTAIIEQNLERLRLVTSRTQLRISLVEYIQASDKVHLEKIKLILDDALASIDSFEVISVLDTNGKIIVSTDSTKSGDNYFDAHYFNESHRVQMTEHLLLDKNNKLKVFLSGPLKMNGDIIGHMLIESEAENIVALVRDYSGLRQTGETLVGRITMDGEHVRYLTPLRFDQAAALKRKIPISDTSSPLVKALTQQKSLLSTAVDYRGQEVLAATNFITDTGWGLVVKIDKAEAFAAINSMVNYFFIIIVAVTIVVIGVSYIFARVISRPIVDLTQAANAINEGDLSRRAEVLTSDEVGELADTFNNMANNLILTQFALEDTNKELQVHREHLEDMVSRRTRELEDKNKELESFAYSVSHDLRSPLRAIDGYSQILQEDYSNVLDEDGKSSLSRIRHATQRMGELIDDLLELSRINRSEILKSKINLSAKVQAVIDRLDGPVNGRKIDVNIEPDIYVEGDDTLMDVVVTNLVSNALKYTVNNEVTKIEFGQIQRGNEKVYF
ncbi:MAG: HAMP domain-containing protein, partial [Gammaproteobacteria bacterium]